MRSTRFSAAIGGVLFAAGLAAAQSPPGDTRSLDLPPDEIPTNLVKVLRTSNKAQTNRYVPKVYDFENVNPYAAIRWVRRTMEIEEGVWYAFANPDLTGGKILVSCPEYQIDGLDQLMALIDRDGLTSSSGSKRILHRLRHRDGSDADLIAACGQEGTNSVEIVFDHHLNAWLVEDAPSGVARVAAAVEEFYDKPTPQLEAMVTVYEIDFTNDGQLGLDYIAWKNGPGRNLFAFGCFAQKEKIGDLDGPGTSSLLYDSGKDTWNLNDNKWKARGKNGAYFYDLPSAYFDFLVAKGKARIMTRTKLVVLNEQVGRLEVGEDILYYQEIHLPDLRAGSRLQPLDPYGDLEALTSGDTTDEYFVNVADHPDNRVVTPELRGRHLGEASTGLFLQIAPVISRDYCNIDLFMSIVSHTGYEDNGYPTLAERHIDTELSVPHDEREITLGGLVRKRRTDSANKMPWLGDIPILGYLFGGESHLEQETLVMATLTCRVVDIGSNVSANDTLIEDQVEGDADLKTADNPPGFITE